MKKYFFKLILALVLVILLLIAAYILLFRVSLAEVECESQFGPCSQSIDEALGKLSGKPIIPTVRRMQDYLGKEKRIKQYSIRFLVPSKLKAYIVEKKGAAALGKIGLNNYFIVDEEGVVLGKEKSTFLPMINVVDGDLTYGPGSKVSDKLKFAVELTSYMFSVYATKLSTLYEDRIEIVLGSGIKVIFPTNGEIDVLLGSLNLILSRLNNPSSEIRIGEVDLRYKNPIIR